MQGNTPTRRTVLRGIGAGTAVLAGGVGTSSAQGGEAGIRVVHASPDAPPVDVTLTNVDDPSITATVTVAFRDVTDYLEVPTGTYEVDVADGLFTAEVTLDAEDYTAVALGQLSEGTFTVKPFVDTNGANIGSDEVRVRAIHASPDAPDVDVTVNDGALTLFEDVAFTESSGYAVVGAGEYNVEVRPAGGGDPVVEADVTFDGGSTYTAFAVGPLDSIELLAVKDKGAPPRGDGGGRGPP